MNLTLALITIQNVFIINAQGAGLRSFGIQQKSHACSTAMHAAQPCSSKVATLHKSSPGHHFVVYRQFSKLSTANYSCNSEQIISLHRLITME